MHVSILFFWAGSIKKKKKKHFCKPKTSEVDMCCRHAVSHSRYMFISISNQEVEGIVVALLQKTRLPNSQLQLKLHNWIF